MRKALMMILLVTLVLAACSAPAEEPPDEGTLAPTLPDPTALPGPTATEIPPVVLNICTASLPETSFPYAGGTSAAKDRINTLLFPPAFELVAGDLTPLTVEKVPSEDDGSLRMEPVLIRRGQTVIDARGERGTATEGIWVRPSGCREAACAITWDGLAPLEMDQMALDFTLKDGLTWSDGTPVTAADAVFSYRLASHPDSPAYGWAEAHTQAFGALDERTVTWVGYPGFATADLGRFFWPPLPARAFEPGANLDAVAADALWAGSPVSYGPFTVMAWGEGEVRLARRPGSSLEVGGFSGVDQVLLRPLEGGRQAGWAALQDGTCDVLDASLGMVDAPERAAVEAQRDYVVHVEPGSAWTQLVFGIRPAEYDGLANPVFAERPDFFADPRTRQALAACLDRETMLGGSPSTPWPSFLPPGRSSLQASLLYDPAAAAALLAEAGWLDHDGDPATPRIAQNVPAVLNNIPLALTLLAGPSPFHQDMAESIQTALAACGVGLEVVTLPLDALYAPGPDGPLFGRQFDLALIAWQPLPGPDCGLYTSWAIPTAANGWIGTNIAGLADPGYDAACTAAALALPGDAAPRLAEAEAAFVAALPSLPLTAPPVIEVWRE
jgi:peptide/nickel transport system substrate-binding protein